MADANIIRRAVRHAANDSIFLAHTFREYREMNGLSENELARRYGCKPGSLLRMSLCLAPNPGSPSFRREVEKIADRFGASAIRLAECLREVDAVRTMRALNDAAGSLEQPGVGFMMAARDRATDGEKGRRRGKRKRHR